MDRQTYEDQLIAEGKEVAGKYVCPSCNDILPAFALVDVTDIPGIPHDVSCGHCLTDALRKATAKIEAETPVDTSWSGELGAAVKVDRNLLLDRWAWVLRIDSPLTSACKTEWADWFLALNQMTVTATGPLDWSFPKEPVLEYMSPEEAAKKLHESI